MEGESGVTRSIFHELPSSDNQGDETEGERGVTRSIIDELLYSDIQLDQMKEKVVLLVVSLTNFILRIFNEIK